MQFVDTLFAWFDENHRVLPWRGENDPYKIWVSEIILQQTRVAQGIGYYHRFLEKFPTVADLAAASETEVLKVWQGLGYYSRARNMYAAAKAIIKEHHGRFPNNYQEIRMLKGIGDYTAAAIASIVFRLPHPAVDGNVLRFACRYFGMFDNIALDTARKRVEAVCTRHLPADLPGKFNQAMMEMGAIVCTPKNPSCENCPFADSCYALLHRQVNHLPVKEQKIVVRERYFQYLIYLCNNQTIIQQRTRNDIWKGLFEFPLAETRSTDFEIADFLAENNITAVEKPQLLWHKKHILTHRRIYAQFWLISVLKLPETAENQQIVDIVRLKDFAVAKITQEAMNHLA